MLVQLRHPLAGLARLLVFFVFHMEDVSYPFLVQVLIVQFLGVAAQITFELGFELRKNNKLVANRHLLLIKSLVFDVVLVKFKLDCIQEFLILVDVGCSCLTALDFFLVVCEVSGLLNIDHDVYSTVIFIAKLLERRKEALVHVAVMPLSLFCSKSSAVFWLSLL